MSRAALAGQWAVVTGASKGIGLGIAGALTEEGANVVLVARGREALESAAAALRARASADQAIVAKVADTSQRDSIAALFEALRVELPVLNVLVANAGSGTLMPFLDYTAAEWDRELALNLTGTFLCCQQAARRMIEAPVGSNRAIVVVSSIRADGVRPGLTGYAVTKAGVNQLVRAAAYELAPHGIRVNALSPGITATPLAQEDNPELFEERSKTVPMGRAGTPADMAAAALYLCSPSASFVTGANLVVDGGESLW
jgi:glucose 1-dehydrogenase